MNYEERTLWISLSAVVCITVLVSIWISEGHNSLSLALACSTIAGIAGYMIPAPVEKNKKEKPTNYKKFVSSTSVFVLERKKTISRLSVSQKT